MGGGYLSVTSCTIAENEIRGVPNPSTPNMSGGGIAATIGNAHTVEDMKVRHSIVVGNTVGTIGGSAGADDLYTGSLLHFYSRGYNLVGRIDFSQILVPIPPWMSLSRKHWPKAGDLDNVAASDLLDLPNVARHASIRSVGTDDGQLAVLWYPPKGIAVDRIPDVEYSVGYLLAEYQVLPGKTDDFLNRLLVNVETEYGGTLGGAFGAEYRATFEGENGMSLDDVVWYMDPARWPSDPRNIPWINFWRGLDNAIAGRLGSAGLGDGFWGSFPNGSLRDNVTMRLQTTQSGSVRLIGSDQLGTPRPGGPMGDVGAIEKAP